MSEIIVKEIVYKRNGGKGRKVVTVEMTRKKQNNCKLDRSKDLYGE